MRCISKNLLLRLNLNVVQELDRVFVFLNETTENIYVHAHM